MNCYFCGNEIGPGMEKIFVSKKGKAFNFCSGKCEKNLLKLKRKPRRVRWTTEYRKEKAIRLKGMEKPPEKKEKEPEKKHPEAKEKPKEKHPSKKTPKHSKKHAEKPADSKPKEKPVDKEKPPKHKKQKKEPKKDKR